MFTDTDCLDRRKLTLLHRIVLGLVGIDLKAYLETSTKEIDIIDRSGRTPISMAAGRDDSDAVKLLLDCGANPNITSPGEGSPLHVAAIALLSNSSPRTPGGHQWADKLQSNRSALRGRLQE